MDRRFLSAAGIVLAIAGSIALAIWKWPREELTDPTPAFEGAQAFAFIDFIKDQGGCRLIRVEYKAVAPAHFYPPLDFSGVPIGIERLDRGGVGPMKHDELRA